MLSLVTLLFGCTSRINRSDEMNVVRSGFEFPTNEVESNHTLSELETSEKAYPVSIFEEAKKQSLIYLPDYFYIDTRTDLSLSDLDVQKFMEYDLNISLDETNPKVLIFHTHSLEMYSDSENASDGVIAVGKRLKEILEQQYNIPTIHNTTAFDVVDGNPNREGAYERMEYEISKIIIENPSIEIIIDLHRDGVNYDTRLVTIIDSKPTAQIQFVNGLSKAYNNDGILESIEDLPNNYIFDNLAFSFIMMQTANELYPGFARAIYLAPFRYSLHMLPKSLLIDVGAQTNTQEEANNAVPIIAEILAKTILP